MEVVERRRTWSLIYLVDDVPGGVARRLGLDGPARDGGVAVEAGRELQHHRKGLDVGHGQPRRRRRQHRLDARLQRRRRRRAHAHRRPGRHVERVVRRRLKRQWRPIVRFRLRPTIGPFQSKVVLGLIRQLVSTLFSIHYSSLLFYLVLLRDLRVPSSFYRFQQILQGESMIYLFLDSL